MKVDENSARVDGVWTAALPHAARPVRPQHAEHMPGPRSRAEQRVGVPTVPFITAALGPREVPGEDVRAFPDVIQSASGRGQ